MQTLRNKERRIQIYGWILCAMFIGSFLFGISCDPQNVLWVIPVCAGWLGASLCSSDRGRIQRQMQLAWGNDAEEYW